MRKLFPHVILNDISFVINIFVFEMYGQCGRTWQVAFKGLGIRYVQCERTWQVAIFLRIFYWQ